MKMSVRLLGLAVILGVWPPAFGATANLSLTSGGPYVLDGVYVGPYTGTINGNTVQIICDDFADDTYVNESWEAVLSHYDTLSSVKWDPGASNQLQLYNEAAWLALQLEGAAAQPGATGSSVGNIQFALWQVFDSAAFTWLANHGTPNNPATAGSAAWWLAQAQNQPFGANEFSFVNVYTPDGRNITCGGAPCSTVPPQEFLYITPEPTTLVLVGTGLAGFLLRRRRQARVGGGPGR